MKAHLYARASTAGQDATRALPELREFAASHNLTIQAEYVENASGANAKRPELLRLLDATEAGDIMLVEAVDRLTRLEQDEWKMLKRTIEDKGIRLVIIDLPTSHTLLNTGDKTVNGIMDAINNMLVDMLAVFARKDYETRRERQAQGIAKAKAAGLYKGSEKDVKARATIAEMLQKQVKPELIMKAAGVSRATFYRVKKELSQCTDA
jgi:DNA invertase Pin-like site-specific DNA recombinase